MSVDGSRGLRWIDAGRTTRPRRSANSAPEACPSPRSPSGSAWRSPPSRRSSTTTRPSILRIVLADAEDAVDAARARAASSAFIADLRYRLGS